MKPELPVSQAAGERSPVFIFVFGFSLFFFCFQPGGEEPVTDVAPSAPPADHEWYRSSLTPIPAPAEWGSPRTSLYEQG